MGNNMFLTGENIYLRGLEYSDLDKGNYLEWLNDPEVCEFNSHHVHPYTRSMAEDYIKMVNSSDKHLVMAVVLSYTNEHIGNISLQGIHPIHRCAEYAVLMGEKRYWGKGYAKEASRLIVEHGFLALNLHRIHCGTTEENIAMQKLADYMGMTKEGRRKEAVYKNGRFVDVLEYGVLRPDFFKKFGISDMAQSKQPAGLPAT